MSKPTEIIVTVGEKVNLGNYQTANVESTLKISVSTDENVQELHLDSIKKLKILNDNAINALYPRS